MSGKKTSQQKRSGLLTRVRPQVIIPVAFVLSLIAALTMLANSGAFDSSLRQKGKKGGTVSIQSLNANNPSKEYVYAGGRLVATEESGCGDGYYGLKFWNGSSPSLGHLTGHVDGSAWSGNVGVDPAGWLSYGPYDTTFGQGHHRAWFLLSIDNVTADSNIVASLDAVTGFGTILLGHRDVRRTDFVWPNQSQWFSVEFDDPCFGYLEARIYWQGNSNIKFSRLYVEKAPASGCGAGYSSVKLWNATSPSLGHLMGRQEGDAWSANPVADSAGWMSYGPYDGSFGQGHHTGWFLLSIDNNAGADFVVTLDVVTAFGTTVLAQRQVRRNEFTAPNQWQWFSVDFDNPCFGYLETRIFWNGTSYLKFLKVYVQRTPSI
ncbi:MAG: hypothetical protein AABO57_19315 [Acidobacteriota bacterium]